ncbi:MAG TPA: TonB-dependent receptor [Ferruginibacter sp.]|jgi:ferric enterobactin receptor|nr:TonB-dependent receptor [Ferruginibacter sp.]
MNRFFLVVLLFALSKGLSAQQIPLANKLIMGKIIDSSTREPIQLVTVSIINQESKKIIKVVISDEKGIFKITDINPGIYMIKLECIGYESKQIEGVIVNDNKPNIQLDNISLASVQKTLSSVVVTANKPIVENKIDKIVYNVANDITSQGAVAIDVLKKVPQVTVDLDGNVELQGDPNIRFLINGKPSSIFGNSLTDALSSIPASQIKSIEVITSPGSKYDAQGTGGIINIILKDNKAQGFNSSVSLSAGTRLENTSINLNVRHNNFGFNLFFSGNAQLSSHTPNSQNRMSIDSIGKTSDHLLQSGYTDFDRNGYQSGIGFDWNITKRNDVSIALEYSHFASHSIGYTNEEEVMENFNNTILSDIYSFRNSDSRSHISSIGCSLDYKKKFKKQGEELEFLYSGSFGKPFSSYMQTQTYKGQMIPYTGSSSNNPGTDNENDISLDYSYPTNKSLVVETGAKITSQNINSIDDVSVLNISTNKYSPVSTQSYNLNYKLQIYAGYISGSFSILKYLNVKTGIRYEYTDANIDFPNTSIPSYSSFVPSITLSHNFNSGNFTKISYSHRIQRPGYNDLNPFLNLSDPYNITTGNPLLRPEIGNNIELGYDKNFNKNGNIYVALIARINADDIKPYTFFYPDYKIGDSTYSNVSVSTRENTGMEYNMGIVASGSLVIKNKLNLRSNILFIQQHNINNLQQGNVTIGYKMRMSLTATYQLSHSFIMELFGNYNSATNGVQGRVPQFATYTFAFRKQFWNKKASIGFTGTNIFNKYVNQVTTVATDNYDSYSLRQVPYRSFGLSFNYKFGKLEFKKAKEDENDYLNNPPNQ